MKAYVNEAVRKLHRSCLTKKSLSKESADRVVDTETKRGNIMYYYKCAMCNSYHITSSPPLKRSVVEII